MTREATAARATGPATAWRGQNRLAPPAIGVEEIGHTLWLLCRAGTIRCALPIEHVVEIMRTLPLEQFAGTPNYVRGLSIIRGAPVPVVDVGLIVGGQMTRPARLVTISAATRPIALAVDEVIGITAIAADAFDALPPLLRDAAADKVSAIGALDCELLAFLCTARLVAEDVLARLDVEGATL